MCYVPIELFVRSPDDFIVLLYSYVKFVSLNVNSTSKGRSCSNSILIVLRHL